MPTKAIDGTKSKFIEALRQTSRGAPAHFGFGRAVETTAKAVLLLAVLPRNDRELAEAAIRAGADAIALRVCGAGTELLKETGELNAEMAALQEIVEAVRERAMIGLIVGSNGAIGPDELPNLGRVGVDFIASYPHLTPAGFLELVDVGRVAIVDQQGPGARGMNDLSIQAVLLRADRPGDSPQSMTILDVATFRSAADGIHRPIIAFPSWKVSPGDVEVLKNAGIEGLALVGPEPDATPDSVEASIRPYADVVGRLGKPVGRRVALTEPSVVLPRLAAPGAEDGDGEGDPDGDDE